MAASALSQATLRMLWAQMKAFFSLERTLIVLLGASTRVCAGAGTRKGKRAARRVGSSGQHLANSPDLFSGS